MTDKLLDQIEKAQADGKISRPQDADEVRTFSAFLTECGPGPGKHGYDPPRWWGAYRKHYPEDAARLAADIAAARKARDAT